MSVKLEIRPQRQRRFTSLPNWSLKVAMAVTGLLLTTFVLIHLFGNLKVFAGPAAFNAYAGWLRHAFYPFLPHGFLLWTVRLVMAAALAVHVIAALILWRRGRNAGIPTARRSWRNRTLRGYGTITSISASLMPVTGVVILVFLGVHLLDLTVGADPVATGYFQSTGTSEPSAYQNLVASFERPWAAVLYAATMMLLSIHVFHGVRAAGNDLGAQGHRLRTVIVWIGGVSALAILLCNGAIPVAVQLGILS